MVEAGLDCLKARMPIAERTSPPTGKMHCGISVVLAETFAFCTAVFALDRNKQPCVDLSTSLNHVRSVKEGYVVGVASP